MIMCISGFKVDIFVCLFMQCDNIGCPVEISPGCKNSRFSDSDRAQEHSAEHYFFLFWDRSGIHSGRDSRSPSSISTGGGAVSAVLGSSGKSAGLSFGERPGRNPKFDR